VNISQLKLRSEKFDNDDDDDDDDDNNNNNNNNRPAGEKNACNRTVGFVSVVQTEVFKVWTTLPHQVLWHTLKL
jgi:hypothetical protein